MKRTTLILEESCLEQIRDLAHREGTQMSKIVNELLAEGLRRRNKVRPKSFELPTFEMGEARVNLADRDALESLMGH